MKYGINLVNNKGILTYKDTYDYVYRYVHVFV